MNIAVVKHIGDGAPNKKYAFFMPDWAVIGKGTLLMLDTQYGEKIGELVDSVNADGAALDYILCGLGTDVRHLKPVKGILVKKGLEQLRAESEVDVYTGKLTNGIIDMQAKRIRELETELEKSRKERDGLWNRVESMKHALFECNTRIVDLDCKKAEVERRYNMTYADLGDETERREAAEHDLREAKARLHELETERDILKSELNRVLKCCGVGE